MWVDNIHLFKMRGGGQRAGGHWKLHAIDNNG